MTNYSALLETLGNAAKKDIDSATDVELAILNQLTDGEGPYVASDEPTVHDLLGFAKRAAESCEHAAHLRAVLETGNLVNHPDFPGVRSEMIWEPWENTSHLFD